MVLLRDEDDTNGYADRKNHRRGLVGWITGRTGQRQYFPSGGDAMGEAAPVSLAQLKEIVKIMEMPIHELSAKAIEDSEQF